MERSPDVDNWFLLIWRSMLKNSDLYFNVKDVMSEEYQTGTVLDRHSFNVITTPAGGDNRTTALNLSTKRTPANHVQATPLDLSLSSKPQSMIVSPLEENPHILKELGLRRVLPEKENIQGSFITDTSPLTPDDVTSSEQITNTDLKSHYSICRTSPADITLLEPTTSTAHVTSSSKSYQCHMCGRSYRQARDFRAHLATHTDGSIFNCDICCRVLSTPSDYLEHLKTHRQKEVMPCPHCGRYFRDSCTLSTHMRTHTGEKPYKCDICGRSFAQTGTYRRHRKGHERKLKM